MAYATISKPSLHFNTLLYVADQQDARNITGVGFQPDWVWIHNRTQSVNSLIYDAVRGVTKDLAANQQGAQNTSTDGLQAFISDGFTHGTGWGNQSTGDNYVAWNWKANGQGSSNTDGSTNTTYTSANTTAGFSICLYEGTGSNATIGHGLGAAPEMIIVKNIDASQNWFVYHSGLGATNLIRLNMYNASLSSSGSWNNTAPTNLVFSVGTESGTNQSGSTHVAYCFKSINGYSKIGTYVGNGNADGTFIYTGFKPAMMFFKKTSGSVANWQWWDNKRDPDNPVENAYHPDSNDADGSPDQDIDFLSNGFKIRSNQHHLNNANTTYIYYAVAEEPLVANVGASIPCTAR